jgi:hypothetical protein
VTHYLRPNLQQKKKKNDTWHKTNVTSARQDIGATRKKQVKRNKKVVPKRKGKKKLTPIF